MAQRRRSSFEILGECFHERPEDRRNQLVATGLLFLWAVAFTAASQLLKREALAPGPASYLAIAVPIALSVAAILAYARFLTRADELLRHIQLEALAIGFGTGFIAAFTLDMLEKAGLGPFEITTPFMVMLGSYLIGIFVAARRYA